MICPINNIVVYLTHLCNFKCHYCSGVVDYENGVMKKIPRNIFINVENVITYLKHFPATNVFLTGGEPTLHPKLSYLIDNISCENLYLYTNLSKPTDYYNKLNNRLKIIASYHNECRDFIDKCEHIDKISHKLVMVDNKTLDNDIKIYNQIKENKYLIRLDNVNYTQEQENILNSLETKPPFMFFNYPTITSSGNLYFCENDFENGMDENDSKDNIILNINNYFLK